MGEGKQGENGDQDMAEASARPRSYATGNHAVIPFLAVLIGLKSRVFGPRTA
jgi:hypothetical protein